MNYFKYDLKRDELYRLLTTQAQRLATATQHTRERMLQALRDNNCSGMQEDEMETGIQSFTGTLETILFPQAISGLMGLKKLIEKDRSRDDETVSIITRPWVKPRRHYCPA